MAEEKPKRRRRVADRDRDDSSAEEAKTKSAEEAKTNNDDDGSSTEAQSKSGRPSRNASGAELAQRARRDLAEITGLEAESVTSLEQADDGSWRVTVELLELSRIPDTDDILGSYEAELDDEGELVGYRRIRRYPRSRASEEQRGEAE